MKQSIQAFSKVTTTVWQVNMSFEINQKAVQKIQLGDKKILEPQKYVSHIPKTFLYEFVDLLSFAIL